jgi:hypothetical protein
VDGVIDDRPRRLEQPSASPGELRQERGVEKNDRRADDDRRFQDQISWNM